jgi:hypothetical protein
MRRTVAPKDHKSVDGPHLSLSIASGLLKMAAPIWGPDSPTLRYSTGSFLETLPRSDSSTSVKRRESGGPLLNLTSILSGLMSIRN